MHLAHLKIRNFRGLSAIDVQFDREVSVIVGPNAIGKTSILEAIRMAKALLTPRTVTESQATLTDMGAYGGERIIFPALAGDPNSALEVEMLLTLDKSELEFLISHSKFLAQLRVRNNAGLTMNELAAIQFLSTQRGTAMQNEAQIAIAKELSAFAQNPTCRVGLKLEPDDRTIKGLDVFSQEAVTILEKNLFPTQTYFSYFPADRAMPSGNANVQIGQNDANQQLQSHLASPAQKYNRLKTLIIIESLRGEESVKQLSTDFKLLFEEVLYGKRFKSVSISPSGTISILIEDVSTGKVYDIDRLSSGEKGLVILFLLMRRSVVDGGIILLDEPELHLNSAVCHRLVSFFVEHIVKRKRIQLLICTHSPEMLADAFERSDCRLFHLRSGDDLSRVFKEDKGEVFEALERLGARTSDVLFSKGTLFVEGIHDRELLETGFPAETASIRITHLNGRNNIQNEIRGLKRAEIEGKLSTPQYFLFDRDRASVTFENSPLVRIRQLDRYCVENFLLDGDAIYDACLDLKLKFPIESRGKASILLKDLAVNQLTEVIIRYVYQSLEPENPGIRSAELKGLPEDEAINVLFARLERIKVQMRSITRDSWIADVKRRCAEKRRELEASWNEDWISLADGKRVLTEVHHRHGVPLPELEFKRRIIEAMGLRKSPNWETLRAHLAQLLRG